jgi:hypothetical protein
MPDEVTITSNSEPASTKPEQSRSADSIRVQLTSLCSLGLGISFFLPWAKIWIGTFSGFDLQKLGQGEKLLWAIPVLCAITIALGFARKSQLFTAQLSGVAPYVVGVCYLIKMGGDLLHLLAFGAYFSLFFGAALFVLPKRSK